MSKISKSFRHRGHKQSKLSFIIYNGFQKYLKVRDNDVMKYKFQLCFGVYI